MCQYLFSMSINSLVINIYNYLPEAVSNADVASLYDKIFKRQRDIRYNNKYMTYQIQYEVDLL